MHIYGDLQRRPDNRRSMSEKFYHHFNIVAGLAMLCTLVVGTTMSDIRSRKTFNHSMWSGGDIALATPLQWVTANCTSTVHYGSYGYGSFEAAISGENLIDAMVAIAVLTRSALIMAYVVLFFAYVNIFLVRSNIYFIRYRNYVFRKSTLTVVELFLSIVGIVGVDAIERESKPVRQYLENCGVTATRTLPFGAPLVYLYVFYAFKFFHFLMCIIALVIHGFRKPSPGVLEEWKAEQFELIKPKDVTDYSRPQIVVAADGTTLGRAYPDEIEEIRRRQRQNNNNNKNNQSRNYAVSSHNNSPNNAPLSSNNNNNISSANSAAGSEQSRYTRFTRFFGFGGGNDQQQRPNNQSFSAVASNQNYNNNNNNNNNNISVNNGGGGNGFTPSGNNRYVGGNKDIMPQQQQQPAGAAVSTANFVGGPLDPHLNPSAANNNAAGLVNRSGNPNLQQQPMTNYNNNNNMYAQAHQQMMPLNNANLAMYQQQQGFGGNTNVYETNDQLPTPRYR